MTVGSTLPALEIPAEDLVRQHEVIADELRAAFESVLPRGKYTLGPQLAAFEAEFATYVGATEAVGISSGTSALYLALRALGVGPGDEVITVANTYVATAFAITYTGALPVFVDVEERTYNLDPDSLREALGERTRAIVPVHLYGRAADVGAIRAAAPGIPILEDAAHAHGATLGDRPVGSLGEVAAFSFYPSKLLGALGDAGIATTSDGALAASLRRLRYMGQTTTKHDHEIIGYQERLDELQAAFLRVKLRHLEDQIESRRRIAARYDEALAATPVVRPVADVAGRHVYYMYTVLAPERDRLADHLRMRGIGTQVIYPRLVPDQRAYRDAPYRAVDLTVARRLVPQLLCLPMFAELTDAEVDRVSEAVRDFYRA
jgi:dTDP-4-amino-4,6-dideoxygalactose transaminase